MAHGELHKAGRTLFGRHKLCTSVYIEVCHIRAPLHGTLVSADSPVLGVSAVCRIPLTNLCLYNAAPWSKWFIGIDLWLRTTKFEFLNAQIQSGMLVTVMTNEYF